VLVEQGTDKQKVHTQSGGPPISGDNLVAFVNHLIRFRDYCNTVAKNNIPTELLSALVNMTITQDNFKTLDELLTLISQLMEFLTADAEKEKYGIENGLKNIPLTLKNGQELGADAASAFKKYGIEMEQGADNTYIAGTDHDHEAVDISSAIKELRLVVDYDPEKELYKFIMAGHQQGRDFKVKFNSEFIDSPLIQQLFELYQPIAPLDQPPFTLAHKEESVQIESKEVLLDAIMEAGKSGLTIQRYKGLGEMDPDELWETTMDPETRVLLQVRAEDYDPELDLFSTLMGDAVEPRREFIQKNALDARNIDI
jgi:DNA gyrase subunit B